MIFIKYISPPQNQVLYKKTSYDMIPEFIVVHNTANIATAEAEINYMHTSDDYRSFHFAVDENEAVQGLPLDVNAWHAGDGENGIGNRRGIGIEICRSYCFDSDGNAEEELWKKDYKEKFEKSQENAAELCSFLMHEYGWGCDLTKVRKHQDFDGKLCPHRTLEYGWDLFLKLVEKKYNLFYGKEKQKYEKWKELPKWAYAPIRAMYDAGFFLGESENNLNISYDLMRMLVVQARILKRQGVIDYEE